MRKIETSPIVLAALFWLALSQPAEAARLWSSGFELNDPDVETTGQVGSAVAVTTPVRSGTYAMKNYETTAAANYIAAQFTDNTGVNGPVYVRAYLYIVTAPSAETNVVTLDTPGGSFHKVALHLKTDRTLVLFNEQNGTALATSSALSTGTWHRLELKYDASAANQTATLAGRLDGALIGGQEFTGQAAGSTYAIGRVRVGVYNGSYTTGAIHELYWDDVAVNDSTGSYENSWPSGGHIAHLRPTSPNTTGWTTAGGTGCSSTTTYACVNEIAPNDATNYLQTATAVTHDLNLDDTTSSTVPSGSTISVVQVGNRVGASSASINSVYNLRLKASGGGLVSGTSDTITGSTYRTNSWGPVLDTVYYPLSSYLNPDTSTAWTTTTLNAAMIGMTQTSGATYFINISTLWALVDANAPPTVTTFSDSPDPIAANQTVTFSLTWSDGNAGERVKVHFCKTNAITASASGGSCPGGTWASSSALTTTSPKTETYVVQAVDAPTITYYAFVCDENACSGTTGNSGTVSVITDITVSGNVYTAEDASGNGTTPLGGTTCNGTTQSVKIVVNAATSYTTSCASGTGAYTKSVTAPTAGDIVTVYLDGVTEKATTVTRAPSSGNITGLHLITNRLILRHEDAGPITNANLAGCDNDTGAACTDTDIGFTSNAGILTVTGTRELHIASGKTFTPGAVVNVGSAIGQADPGSDLHVFGTFNPTTMTIYGGSITGTGTISQAFAGFTYLYDSGNLGSTGATYTFFYLYLGDTVNVKTTTGTGGTITATQQLVVRANHTLSLGANSVTVGSNSVTLPQLNVVSGGTFSQTTGTTTFLGANATTACIGSYTGFCTDAAAGSVTFGNLTIGDTSTTVIGRLVGTNINVAVGGVLTIATAATFNGGGTGKTLTLSGAGTPLVRNGTFTASLGTVKYTSSTGVTALSSAAMTSSDAFYNLQVDAASQTFNVTQSTEVTNVLTVAANTTLNAGSSTINLTGAGTPFALNGNFTASSSTVNYLATTAATNVAAATYNSLGVGISADSSTGVVFKLLGTTQVNGLLTVGNVGSVNSDTLDTDSVSNHALTASSVDIKSKGTLTANASVITLTGSGTPLTIGGVFNAGTSTVKYTSTSATSITATAYGTLELKPSGAGSPIYTLGTAASQTITVNSDLTVGDGTNAVDATAVSLVPTLDVGGNLTISANATLRASLSMPSFQVGGNWVTTGTFVHNNGTVTFDKASGTQTLNAGSSNFYNLVHSGAGMLQLASNVTLANDLQNNAGTLAINSKDLTVNGGDFTGAGSVVCGATDNTCSAGTVKILNNGSVGGAGTYTFYQLILEKNAGTIGLAGNIGVVGWFWCGQSVPTTCNTNNYSITGSSLISVAGSSTTNSTLNAGSSAITGSRLVLYNFLNSTLKGTFDATTSTVTLTQGAGVTNLEIGGGTFTAGSGTVVLTGGGTVPVTATAYNRLQVNNATGNFVLQGTTTLSSDLTVTTGSLSLNGKDLTMTGINITGTGTIYCGNGNNNLPTDSPAGTCGGLVGGIGTLSLDGGTYTFYNLQVTGFFGTGRLTLQPGSYTVKGSLTDGFPGAELWLNGVDLTVGGDLNISQTIYCGNGNHTCSTGTVTKTGTGNLHGGNPSSFYHLTLGDGTTTATTTASTSFTVYGDLTIAANHTLNGGATSPTITLAGTDGTPCAISGTLTPNTNTIVYSGDNASGNTTVAAATYNHLQINNAAETYNAGGAVIVGGDLTVTAGTLAMGANTLTVNGGDITGAGTITQSATGLTTLTGTGNLGGGTYTFYNVTLGNGTTAATTTASGGNVTVSNVLTIRGTGGGDAVNHTFNGGNGVTTTLTGSGSTCPGAPLTPLVINGTFTANSSYIKYAATSGCTNVTSTTYSRLFIDGSGGTFNLGTGAGQTITAGSGICMFNGTVKADTYNPTINSNGDYPFCGVYTIGSASGVTYAKGSGTITLGGGTTMWDTSTTKQDLGTLVIDAAIATGSSIKATSVTINNAKSLDISDDTLTLTGITSATCSGTPLCLSGTGVLTENASSTVEFAATSGTTTVNARTYGGNLKINGSGGTFDTGGNVTVTGTLTDSAGTFRVGTSHTVTAANVTVNGGTLSMPNASGVLKLNNGGTLSMSSGKLSSAASLSPAPCMTASGGSGCAPGASTYYAVSLTGGELDVSTLQVDGLNSLGFVVGSGVTLTAFNNVTWGTSGTWNGQAGAPEILLDLTAQTKNLLNHVFPTTWANFASGDCNVRANTAGVVTMWDWTGAFGGEEYDCDTSGGEVVWKGGVGTNATSGNSGYPAIY